MKNGIEYKLWEKYLDITEDERLFTVSNCDTGINTTLIVTEGFERRSLGILEKIAASEKQIGMLIIGRYSSGNVMNKRYRDDFEKLAQKVAPGKWFVIENNNDGMWIENALTLTTSSEIILDITGFSNRGLFGALDCAVSSKKCIKIGYSEAQTYWPKKSDWDNLEGEILDPVRLSEVVDSKPWMFGAEHSVEIIPGHEGYDSAGAGRALIAFLPFKCARLAAIVGDEEYSECLFIAGKPRLDENAWRLDCLRKINEPIIKDWQVEIFSTFSYRQSLSELGSILFREKSMLSRHDVHLAILGSKIQSVSCWALSHIVRSITFITSIPKQYHPESFSEGIGSSWLFQLVPPINSIE